MKQIKAKIEALATETIEAHKKKYTPLKKRWNGLIDRYENKLRADSISEDTESKITLGGAFSLVENSIPRLMSNNPRYKYLGRENDDGKSTEVYDEFAKYQWEEADGRETVKKIARWGLACGLAGWKMGWKEEKTLVKEKAKEVFGKKVTNPVLVNIADKVKLGRTIKEDKEQTVANYELIPIKPHDLIWSIESEEVKDCRVFGHRTNRLVKELRTEGYDVKGVVKNLRATDKVKDEIEKRDGMVTEQYVVENQRVNVAELYITWINENGVTESYMIAMAYAEGVDPTTILFEKNPLDKQFTPMGIFRPIDRLGKFYGFGLIEPSTGVLDAEEDSLNMAAEALWTDITKPMEYNPSNVLDIDSLEYKPRVLIPVNKLGESVNPLPTPTPRMDSVNFVTDYLQRAKQNITGVTDFQTGSDQLKGAKTLGEIKIKTQESNLRLSEILKALEKQVLNPMGKMSLWYNQQYLAEQKEIIYRIVGRKGQYLEKKAKFKDIEAVKDIMIVSGSTADVIQSDEIQKWTLLLNQVYEEEKSPNPVPINKEPIWEKLIEQGLLEKDVETFIPSLAEREKESVEGDMAQLEDAKSENVNPMTARVLASDNHIVHMKLHKAEIEFRQRDLDAMGENEEPRLVEEMQMLIEHQNNHAEMAGGAVPPFSQTMQVGQGLPPEALNKTPGQPSQITQNEQGQNPQQ